MQRILIIHIFLLFFYVPLQAEVRIVPTLDKTLASPGETVNLKFHVFNRSDETESYEKPENWKISWEFFPKNKNSKIWPVSPYYTYEPTGFDTIQPYETRIIEKELTVPPEEGVLLLFIQGRHKDRTSLIIKK